MLNLVRETGIFIVIAQAILYFVPNETYAKYVKVLIGIMIIAKLVSPVFSLLRGENWEEMIVQSEWLSEELQMQQDISLPKDSHDRLIIHYSEMLQEQNEQIQKEETINE